MIKGVARHAVIVKSPELKDVEQAIFIMSGAGDEPQVASHSEMLSLAGRLAGYSSPPARHTREKGTGALVCAMWFLAGCATAACAMWALSMLMII